MADAPYEITPNTPYAALPEQLTVEEYVAITRMCRATAYQHVREGKIPAIRYGKLIRIPKSVLQDSRRVA